MVLNGKTSGWARVGSGVPEGSICGPLLFVLYCNDVPLCLASSSSSCLMYADDLKLFRRVRTPEDSAALQADLDKLCTWSETWKLKLNPIKCKAISFTLRKNPVHFDYKLHNVTLERVSVMRDLGVLLDSKLTFGPHVDGVVQCANRALGVYLRSLQTSRSVAGGHFSPGPLLTAFNAHVRSIIEFGSVIWAGAARTHLLRLERVQHKMLMWLATNSTRPSSSLGYDHLLTHFGVLSVQARLQQRDLSYMHAVFAGRARSSQVLGMFGLAVPARRTRGRPVLHVPVPRVETIKMVCCAISPSR